MSLRYAMLLRVFSAAMPAAATMPLPLRFDAMPDDIFDFHAALFR